MEKLNSRTIKESKRKGKYGNVPFNYNPNKDVKVEIEVEPDENMQGTTVCIKEEKVEIKEEPGSTPAKVFNTKSPSHSGKCCF